MGMIETKSFKSGNSVAVRLPAELGVPAGVTMAIERIGAELRIILRDDEAELLQTMRLVPFDAAIVPIYGEIVAACGYSRRQVFDRLIAATAILHDLTLVTLNGADFADIPDLRLEVWPAQ
jgi:predicted nucleic acid-binding protein